MIYVKGIKCPYCGHTKDSFDFLRYLYDRKKEDLNKGVTCDKCGKTFDLCFGGTTQSQEKKEK